MNSRLLPCHRSCESPVIRCPVNVLPCPATLVKLLLFQAGRSRGRGFKSRRPDRKAAESQRFRGFCFSSGGRTCDNRATPPTYPRPNYPAASGVAGRVPGVAEPGRSASARAPDRCGAVRVLGRCGAAWVWRSVSACSAARCAAVCAARPQPSSATLPIITNPPLMFLRR